MPTRKVDLQITPAGHSCRLYLDGQEVENCRSVTIRAGVDQISSVVFELINVEVSVVGEVDNDKVDLIETTNLSSDAHSFMKVVR